jgi:hypothetical protein
MLNGMARRLEKHFAGHGKGNFGTFGVLDWMHGTSSADDVMQDLFAEMEKHDVAGKAGNAKENASNMIDGAKEKFADKAKSKAKSSKRQ